MLDMTAILAVSSGYTADTKSSGAKANGGADFSAIMAGHNERLANARTKEAPQSQTSGVKKAEARTETGLKDKKELKQDPAYEEAAAAAAQMSAYQAQNTNPTDQTEAADAAPDMEVNSVTELPQTQPGNFMTQALLTMLGNVEDRQAFLGLLEQLGMEMPQDPSQMDLPFEEIINKLLEDLSADMVTFTMADGTRQAADPEALTTYQELAALLSKAMPSSEALSQPETESADPFAIVAAHPALDGGEEQTALSGLKQTLQSILAEIQAAKEQPVHSDTPADTQEPVVRPADEQPAAAPVSSQTDLPAAETEEPAATQTTKTETDELTALFHQNNVGNDAPVNVKAPAEVPPQPLRADVIAQLTEAASLMKHDGTSTLEIQLHPAHLGKVSILLESGPDGVTAQFKAQNDHVKNMLATGLAELSASLKDMGVNMKNIEVSQSEIGFDFTRTGPQDHGRHEHENNGQEQNSARTRRIERSAAAKSALSQALYGGAQTKPQSMDDNVSVEFIA